MDDWSAVGVIFPYAGDSRFRAEALLAVWRLVGAALPGATLVMATLDVDRPWCKAEAVARGLDMLPEGITTMVMHDADSHTPGLRRAVRRVVDGRAGWAVPHWNVHRMTREASRSVLDGTYRGDRQGLALERPVYQGVLGGGVVVLPIDTYRRVPLDPGFGVWGREDQAWGLALKALGGPLYRGDAGLWHFWHPGASKEDGFETAGSAANEARYQRYLRARQDGTMADLVAEIGPPGSLPPHEPGARREGDH